MSALPARTHTMRNTRGLKGPDSKAAQACSAYLIWSMVVDSIKREQLNLYFPESNEFKYSMYLLRHHLFLQQKTNISLSSPYLS